MTNIPQEIQDLMPERMTERQNAAVKAKVWGDISMGYNQSHDQWVAVLPQMLALAEKRGAEVTEDTSDGYHTFRELYEFRLLYNAHLLNEWAKQGMYDVYKSQRHADGELCFGRDDYFIVVATLPTGKISNHYPMSDWDLFKCKAVEKAKHEWDGHTSQDVASRLRETLTQPNHE